MATIFLKKMSKNTKVSVTNANHRFEQNADYVSFTFTKINIRTVTETLREKVNVLDLWKALSYVSISLNDLPT